MIHAGTLVRSVDSRIGSLWPVCPKDRRAGTHGTPSQPAVSVPVPWPRDLWLLIDQAECHDQTALHRVSRNDESLSIRVDVILRAVLPQVVGKLEQHVALSDRYVVPHRQLIRDQFPSGIPVEELLPIGSPDRVFSASAGDQPLVPGFGEALNVYFELTGLVLLIGQPATTRRNPARVFLKRGGQEGPWFSILAGRDDPDVAIQGEPFVIGEHQVAAIR